MKPAESAARPTAESPSPSPRKAWIETQIEVIRHRAYNRRLPPGRRGLKPEPPPATSHPTACRLPPGRRGLKQQDRRVAGSALSRLPPGRRGLKLILLILDASAQGSPSPRKAWIETLIRRWAGLRLRSRLPPGRRGLKLNSGEDRNLLDESPSPRKAWIETRPARSAGSDAG